MRRLIWLIALGMAALSASPASAVAQPGVGTPITLNGYTAGERITVTPTKIVAPAQPASEFDQPAAGHGLVGIQFQLTNIGTAPYDDAPDNGAVLTDVYGQRFSPSLNGITAGPSFPAIVKIAPGATALGFIVFELPADTQVSTVQFTLDSGTGPDTGEWSLPPAGTGEGAPQPSGDPAAVVTAYYEAINNHDYNLAWELGGRSFVADEAQFAADFAATALDTLTITGVSGDTVSVTLDALQTDGTHQYYAGTYTVQGGVIVGADVRRTG